MLNPKNNPSLRMYKNVRVPPWDDIKPQVLRKSEKYFFSQAVARYWMIFKFIWWRSDDVIGKKGIFATVCFNE